MTIFFRLLKTEIDAKPARLAEQVNVLNAGQSAPDTFVVDPTEFKQIPGSPFAYWVSKRILSLYSELPLFEDSETVARVTNPTADNFRFLRNFWECSADLIERMQYWVPYAKGGAGKKFHYDINLVVAWDDEAKTYRGYRGTIHRPDLRPANLEYFFRPGIMWPLRASQLCAQVFPEGSTFSARSQCLFAPREKLAYYVGLLNSTIVDYMFKLALGRFGFPEFLVGVLRNLPKPIPNPESFDAISQITLKACELVRLEDCSDETTHAFCLPALVSNQRDSLHSSLDSVRDRDVNLQARLAAIQTEIDSIVAGLYGLTESDLTAINIEELLPTELENEPNVDEESDEDAGTEIADPKSEIENLLMWCAGCVFGRWDIRFALDPSLLPKLQEPFDPLPRCSPGMLVGVDGLPAQKGGIVSEEWLRARSNVITLPDVNALKAQGAPLTTDRYPLEVDWDGIIPDDEHHPDDIVRRVREVLELLWKERAEAIEQEACALLGIASLREYFRQPKYFFDFHIKRYSKSRRKAPIYWLLQSAKKNYGLWIYYHRLDADTLFKALTLYAEPKLRLENIRLDDLRAQFSPEMPARDRRALEKAIAKQEALISELTDFRNELERVARLQLTSDFNDGVIISIAPLHNLVPWKEAAKIWDELKHGKYTWSTMSQRMRPRGLVRN